MESQDISTRSLTSIKSNSIVHQRHLLLYDKYQKDAESAWITDAAEVIGVNLQDPFRTSVLVNEFMQVPFKIGVHKAVGGDHDFPNPGDLLCASLAACFESTLRLIANKLSITLLETKIKAIAQIDVRGTLMIDKSVPVGFQAMHIEAFIISECANEKLLNNLIRATKHSCIIYQTIKQGTPITLNVNFKLNN